MWKTALKAEEVDKDDVQGTANTVVRHVTTTLARQAINLDDLAAYQATALSVKDRLIKRWNETTSYHTKRAPKRVYYLSIEWLMGRSLDNAVLNLDVRNTYETATQKLGFVSEAKADRSDCRTLRISSTRSVTPRLAMVVLAVSLRAT